MKRAQTEAGFQWVLVLFAGGALLIFFFLVARGCAQSGQERAEGIAAQAVASRIQAAVWQPESASNMTAQPLEVACVGGVLTLSSERASSPVERAPVFLPPRLQGRDTLLSRPLAITRQGSPDIPLGSALYVLDEQTYYVLLLDGDGVDFPFTHQNVIRADGAFDVPRGARTVILIADGGAGYVTGADVAGLPDGATVVGVSISGEEAEFFARRDGAMVSVGKAPAEHASLRAGAMASGDPAIYRCARQSLLERTRSLTRIYETRAGALAYDLPYCAAQLTAATALLKSINDDPAYLDALFSKERELAQLQNALLLKSCPVIA